VFVDDNERRWLIQVKCRANPRKSEGFSTLQSVLGTLALEGERHGMIVTNADSFSYQARQERLRARNRGFVVELVDKGLLDRMVGALLPSAPWADLFQHEALGYIDTEVRSAFIGWHDPLQGWLF
jgi:hypothetical protein